MKPSSREGPPWSRLLAGLPASTGSVKIPISTGRGVSACLPGWAGLLLWLSGLARLWRWLMADCLCLAVFACSLWGAPAPPTIF